METFRCPKCKRKLFRGKVVKIEIKCPKCGYVFTVTDDKKNILTAS